MDKVSIFVLGGQWGTEWRFDDRTGRPMLFIPYNTAQPVLVKGIASGTWEAEVTGLGFRGPKSVKFVRQVSDEATMLRVAEDAERAKNGGFLLSEIAFEFKKAIDKAGLWENPDGKDVVYFLRIVRARKMTRQELASLMDADIAGAIARKKALVTTLTNATKAQSQFWYYRLAGKRYGEHVKALPRATEENVLAFLKSEGIVPEILAKGYQDEESSGGDTQGGGHWVD